MHTELSVGASVPGARKSLDDDGEGGIRTLEGRKTSPVFETGSFNHSDTSPNDA